MVNYSPDNYTQVEAKKGTLKFEKVWLRIDNISLLQDLGTKICGYEYWTNVTNDVTGCDEGNFQFPVLEKERKGSVLYCHNMSNCLHVSNL